MNLNPSNRFDFTDEVKQKLYEAHKKSEGDMSLSAAARIAGCHHVTLRKAASRRGELQWLTSRFPHRPEFGGGGVSQEKSIGGMRWLTPEQIKAPLDIDWNSPYVRSAAMLWRGVA